MDCYLALSYVNYINLRSALAALLFGFLLTYGSLIFREGHQIVAQGKYKSQLESSITVKCFAVEE
jgi:hypothetical protein